MGLVSYEHTGKVNTSSTEPGFMVEEKKRRMDMK
jgi:hypothetical protein